MNKVNLRDITDLDIVLIEKWLEYEHVKKWFHDANDWLNEIKLRHSDFSFVKHKIVLVEQIPIGFCQYYDCYYSKEECYPSNTPNNIFSIDYFIGEKDYLNQGLGTQIVNELISEIRKKETCSTIMVKPEKSNIISAKTLLSAGMKYDENTQCYCIIL